MERRKLVSLILVLVLCGSLVLAGCGSSDKTSTTATPQSSDSSAQASGTKTSDAPTTAPALDKVALTMYLLGSAPVDGPAVMEEVNKKLEKDINATITLQYIAFGDIATKYPLVLASGQDWDVIYGSVNYGANAAKHGYREITLEDVEKNAPLSFKATTKDQWVDTMVNGKIYMIPQTFKELDVSGLFYREDLRKKFGCPEIKTSDDFIAYMETLKKNGITPIDGNADDVAAVFSTIFNSNCEYSRNKLSFDLLSYSVDDPSYKLVGILDPEYAVEYKKAAVTVKKFHDEGVLPKNAFSQKSSTRDLYMVEKTAVWSNAFENYPQYASDCKSKGWEVGFFGGASKNGTALLRPSTGNGFSFSPSSKNYERALMAVDLINQELTYNMLLSFGIEGKNYVMKDGKLALAPGVDATKNPYPMYGAGFWSCNRDQWPPLENYTQAYIDMKKNFQEHSKSNILNGFVGVDDSIKTEVSNITNVYTQYAMPIKLGLAKDPNAAIDTYIEKLKAAGAQKAVDEYKKQIQVFLAANIK